MDTSPGVSLQRTIFVIVHALACFYHHVWHEYWAVFDGSAALAVVALVVVVGALWMPGSMVALTALLVINIVDVAYHLPVVPNHWLLTGLFDACLLAGIVATRGAPDMLSRVREPLAVGLAIFYFYTGFWKLTAEFFDPSVSCGVLAWHRLVDQFGFLPRTGLGPWMSTYGTVVLELVLPFFMVWRRTRSWAFLVFVGFHVLLGLDIQQNFLNFSTVMLSMLMLTFDAETFERFDGLQDRILAMSRGVSLLLVGIQPLLWVDGMQHRYASIRWTTWVVIAGFLLYLYVKLQGPVPRPKVKGPAWMWAFAVLVVLNGAMPILGVKTRNSWQMYANLRLEAQDSNHFLLPRSLDVLGLLSDEVTVLDISDPELRALWVVPDRRVTWYMLRTEASRQPEMSVRYERAGQVHDVPRVGDDPELSRPYNLLMRKYVWYRPLGAGIAESCQW